jgi:hypothetical protein
MLTRQLRQTAEIPPEKSSNLVFLDYSDALSLLNQFPKRRIMGLGALRAVCPTTDASIADHVPHLVRNIQGVKHAYVC